MRYYIKFSKTGNIKYISHLDMQRLFKRAFKHAGIPIEYSQGYNPHPKMGFAQPLSLGYTASKEYLEFYTTEDLRLDIAHRELRDAMPGGIDIYEFGALNTEIKSLAADVVSAVYSVTLPIPYMTRHEDVENLIKKYLDQDQIIAKKREKKSKQIVDKDIKGQIRSIKVLPENEGRNKKQSTYSDDDGMIVLEMELDSGSNSNLSPEQVISSFTEFSELYLPREEIEVNRDEIKFGKLKNI